MQLFSWLYERINGRTRSRHAAARKPAARFRPHLESLEHRDVPSTLTVTNADVEGVGGLRAEITAAANGDKIVFASSLSGKTIQIDSQLVITKNLTIQGPGAGQLAISGDNVYTIVHPRIFEVAANANVPLSGLTLEHGGGTAVGYANNGSNDPSAWDQDGGAVLNLGTLTINACTVTGNSAGGGEGGGILRHQLRLLRRCHLQRRHPHGHG